MVVWGLQFTVADSLDPYLFTILMYAGINIILATSLNLVNGFTGQFSIGHAGFMSVGGYTAAFISTSVQAAHPDWFNVPSFITSGAPGFEVHWLAVLPTAIFLLS